MKKPDTAAFLLQWELENRVLNSVMAELAAEAGFTEGHMGYLRELIDSEGAASDAMTQAIEAALEAWKTERDG